MKYTIAYHPTYRECEDIITVEAGHIMTKGKVQITSVINSIFNDDITIYVNQLPHRIDQQGDAVFIMDEEYANDYPEPKVFCKPFSTFGKPHIIFRSYDCSPEYYQKLYNKLFADKEKGGDYLQHNEKKDSVI